MIVAIIPTRYEPKRLRALLAVVVPDVDLCLVMDNGHARLKVPTARVVDARGMGIYRMWNEGWQLAREEAGGQPFDLAILNDDIGILPGTLRLLARALRADDRIGAVYPDTSVRSARLPDRIRYTTEWDPAGGRSMTGFCFVFKGELDLPPFDEGMEWWYGDSEFDESVKLAGYGVARIDGVPIRHVSDAEANDWARRPELKAAVERDGARWAERHHEIVDGRWIPREGAA